MAQASPQFSAAQILEAGRRAESDGRFDYAVQFYRHLTDHHGRTPEAASARESLSRLSARRAADPAAGSAPVNGHAKANGHAPAHTGDAAAHAGAMPVPAAAMQDSARRHAPTQPGTAIAISPMSNHRIAPVTLPEQKDHYRLGRALARIVGVLGWIFVATGLAGFAVSIAAIASPGSVAAVAKFGGSGLIGLVPAGATLLTGLSALFLAQLARALFDTANAARDAAAVGRATHEQ